MDAKEYNFALDIQVFGIVAWRICNMVSKENPQPEEEKIQQTEEERKQPEEEEKLPEEEKKQPEEEKK